MVFAQSDSIGRVIVAALRKWDHVRCIDEGKLSIWYPNA
jgi:hypothetical protein